MKKVVSAIGALLIIYMLCLFFNVNYNTGIAIGIIIGIGLVWLPLAPTFLFVKIIKFIFGAFICFFIFMSGFIAINSITNTADFSEDALIVLGCGLNGSEPSVNLVDRLDTACEYYENNSSAVIIVSGGQGPQEEMPEAEAMYDYLINKGIPMNKIFKEEKSASTNENFKFSKEILDSMFDADYSVAYITNDFHIYRAGKLAQLNGLNAKGYGAPTEIFSVIPNYLRESLAVLKLWIFNE